jgi:hypothetical protein
MRRPVFVLLAALATRAPDLAAQPGPGLAPGRRVRVTAPAVDLKRWEGTVASVRGDTLVLRPIVDAWTARYRYPVDTAVRVSLDAVERLEVRRSVRGRLWKGFGLGALGGAVLGAVVGLSQGKDELCDGLGCIDKGAAAGALAVVGASVGGLVGLSIAAATAERWQPAPLDGPRVGLGAARRGRGVALGLTMRY